MGKKHKLIKLLLSVIFLFSFLFSCASNAGSLKNKNSFVWNEYKGLDYSIKNRGNGKINFFLMQPDNPKDSPLVILIHGYMQSKEAWLGDEFTHGELVTEKLLERGASVLLPDLPFHGSNYDENGDQGESIWGPSKYPVFIQMFIDDIQIILAYLSEKTEIDTTRIALVGYSLGSSVSFPLINAVADVDTSALCVPIPFLNNRSDVGPMKCARQIDIPILLISASKDDSEIVNDVPFLFDIIPSNIKEHKWYDSGHNLPAEYSNDVINWLDDYFFNSK